MAHVHQIRRLAEEIRVGFIGKDGVTKSVKGKRTNKAIGQLFADDLNSQINVILHNLKFYAQGKQAASNVDTHGIITVSADEYTSTVRWKGRRIAYIEYGAGAPAVGKYKGDLPSWYQPQAEGHSGGDYWVFRGELINGWRPYAPYLRTYWIWQNKLPVSRKNDIYDIVSYSVKKKVASFAKTKKSLTVSL